MRAVGQHRHASGLQSTRDFSERQNDRGVGHDVLDDGDARVRGDRSHEGVGDRDRFERLGHLHGGDTCATFASGVRGGLRDSPVTQLADEHLVARLEWKRAEHGIRTRGGVINEDHILASRLDERRDAVGSHSQARLFGSPVTHDVLGQLAELETARLALGFGLNRALGVEDTSRRCANGRVIQIGD